MYKSKTALGAYYRRLRARMGAPKAITAAARKLAILIYRMLKQKTPYREIPNLERKAAFFGFELKKREQDGPQAQIE